MSFNVGDKVVTVKPLSEPTEQDYVPVGESGTLISIPYSAPDGEWPYLVSFDKDCYVSWLVAEDEIRAA